MCKSEGIHLGVGLADVEEASASTHSPPALAHGSHYKEVQTHDDQRGSETHCLLHPVRIVRIHHRYEVSGRYPQALVEILVKL